MAKQEKSRYKIRKAQRLHGAPPKMREKMPYWYESAMLDFRKRDAEQAEAARSGPLSTDRMVPWGNERVSYAQRRDRAEEVAETEEAVTTSMESGPRSSELVVVRRSRPGALPKFRSLV
jgi:hypothetical protein